MAPWSAMNRGVGAAAAATSAADTSRMQRQWPSGQAGGPCRSQGRQGRVSRPIVIDRGASGPKPKPGTVGPKIATVGVPMADARCCGEESLVTSTPLARAARRRPAGTGARSRSDRNGAGSGVRRRRDLGGQRRVATAANDRESDPRRQGRGQLGVAAASAWWPRRCRARARPARRRLGTAAEQRRGGGVIGGRWHAVSAAADRAKALRRRRRGSTVAPRGATSSR